MTDAAPRVLDAALGLLLEVLPFLSLGALIAGGLEPALGRVRWACSSGRSLVAVLVGAVLGCVVPVCSCGVVPVAIGLLAGGVAPGPVLAFLAAGPMIHPVSFLLTGGLLGWGLAAGRLVGALGIGILAGLLGNALGPGALRRGGAGSGSGSCGCAGGGGRPASGPLVALYRAGEIFAGVLPWVLAGALAGATLEVLVDPESLGDLLRGQTAVFVSAAAAVPLYVCSCAEVPVALSLLRKGVPAGAVLTFLLAGPGVSVFSVILLSSVLRARAIAAYMSMFLAASAILGLLWSAFLP